MQASGNLSAWAATELEIPSYFRPPKIHLINEMFPFSFLGTARTQSQLPKIVHPKQPRFADVANVNPPRCNGRSLLGGASSLIKASPVPGGKGCVGESPSGSCEVFAGALIELLPVKRT
ncbi:hypothetical protein AVEN_73984-1 [Araneus ventricosus]|uniref:Uncharacterized protein n=1 Tax=Araneus ventricosus TaxID=182803 RepID=A0A4Y2V3D8_ARAVE|nr:hypothetical protein AVEN_73984-1 [Araneus ventricosus]